MLRSVKYGLYGAVLAGLVGGTVAWTNVDKSITLVVDGKNSTVHTTAANVSGVLSAAGYHSGPHDLLAPSAGTSVHDGSKIVYDRGRLLHLDVNGHREDVWTTATTVAQALAQLGYPTSDFTSVSRSTRLPLSATDIMLRTPKLVTVKHDGRTERVSTTAATVDQLLHDLDITVGRFDRLSEPGSSALTAGVVVTVQRVKHATVTETTNIPYPTTTQKDPNAPAGETTVVTAGQNGTAQVTYALVYVDGKIIGKTRIKTVVVKSPRAQVVKVGTQQAPPAAPASPGSAQAIAQQMVADRGWGSDQFNCLVTLWDHESGWNVNATNSGSGAYGIPQALPGSKMASAGPDWQNSARTQITWGLDYIAGRYSTPCNAWSTWQAHGGWY